MLVMILNFLFLTLNIHAGVCEYLFVKEDVHLSRSDQKIAELSAEYKGWFEVSLNRTQFLSSLKNQKVALVSLRSSHLFQHYKIEKIESVVKSVEYSPATGNPILILKNGMSVPWARVQKLFIDPNKLSSSVFSESEKHFKLYHYSKHYKQQCVGCVELGSLLGTNYMLSSKAQQYYKHLVVFYDHNTKKIRLLKNATVSELQGLFQVKDHRTGQSWMVPKYEVGFVGVSLPHGH